MKAKPISASTYSSAFIDENGSMWACGRNQFGELGFRDSTARHRIEKVDFQNIDLPIFSIAMAKFSTLILDIDGSVFGGGRNFHGELGLGHNTQLKVFRQILNIPKIICIDAGMEHAIFLDEEHNIWCAGQNSEGQLGLGDTKQRNTLTKNDLLLKKTRSIFCGAQLTMAIDEENEVWYFGKRVGLEIGDHYLIGLPTKIINLQTTISFIACGKNFILLLDTEGKVWACGNNKKGQLGLGNTAQVQGLICVNTLPPIQHVACGLKHSIFLDREGNTWACGSNELGQLGFSTKKDFTTPTKHDNLPPIIFIECGSNHSIFMDEHRTLWVCGCSYFGRIGVTTKADVFTPTKLDYLPPLVDPRINENYKIKNARNL